MASALKNSDYLITLDKEFFKSEIQELASKRSLIILTPKEFIESRNSWQNRQQQKLARVKAARTN